MKQVLLVTNGHGEAAIADRIADELRALLPDARFDHLALVGNHADVTMRPVGPRRPMPSGGLIAMGNARNLFADLRAGLLGLTLEQARFLRQRRGTYDAVVAVGDAYALAMALLARSTTVFVGTAKSVEVAPYGPFEARLLARAQACFVRDAATAQSLRQRGVEAESANAIVDLVAAPHDPGLESDVAGLVPILALFPGSRESAYDDADFLLGVTRELAARRPTLGAILSVARGLDANRFANDAARAGWNVERFDNDVVPFVLRDDGRARVFARRGALGPVLAQAVLVLGQAGTANEAAAAAGVPVIAFERDRDRKTRWYRERQRGLLGEALAVLPAAMEQAVAGVGEILDDGERRARMSAAGRARMGRPGGAARIAARIASLVA
ncbi:MAG: hypothetical protein JOZ77_06995 [Candidatus Eremiobacteraeota bacterium]|nr:hypothetical protein [Candidatus Eremiobacteraeota bacterium]